MNAVVQLPRPAETVLDAVKLHAILQACPQGLALSECGQVVFANAAFTEQLGLVGGPETRSLPLADLLPGISPDDAFETDYLAPNGKVSRLRATPLGNAGGDALLLSAFEIPSLDPAPPAPGQMEAVGRLVSGVAHDFNNLLTGILLYCELLRRGVDGDARLVRYIDEMRAAGEQAAALIQQLMSVSRKPATESVALSWNEAVGNLEGLLRRLIGENIQLVCDLDRELKLVRLRPAQMPQVILNLALNARDAMADGGTVTLATRNAESGGHVELMVSDNGCGMDEPTQVRVLEPFFTTKPPGQGNGMGLATVRRIVEEHGGSLKLESCPGRGTRVSVRLPAISGKVSLQKGNSL